MASLTNKNFSIKRSQYEICRLEIKKITLMSDESDMPCLVGGRREKGGLKSSNVQPPVDVEKCLPGDTVGDVHMLMMGVGRGWWRKCDIEKEEGRGGHLEKGDT